MNSLSESRAGTNNKILLDAKQRLAQRKFGFGYSLDEAANTGGPLDMAFDEEDEVQAAEGEFKAKDLANYSLIGLNNRILVEAT